MNTASATALVDRPTFNSPVSILMPVSNEVDVIESVVREWARDVMAHLPAGSEMLFDEAASTDGTREVLRRMCAEFPFISVEYHEAKDGFAAAARRLYLRANCPWVFFTDSDGQYIGSEFWKLAPFAATAELIHGAKIGRQDTFFRKTASALFNRIARFVFDIHYSDINSAFRLVRRDLVREMVPRVRHMPTLLNAELLIRAEADNRQIKQVRVLHRTRQFGNSRGLPPMRFAAEAVAAYRGLLRLKAEYRR